MSSFKATLKRVLDPDGLYWVYPGDEKDDAARPRVIEVRLDIPSSQVEIAEKYMVSKGWRLASKPDEPDDSIQRLYFRVEQDVLPENRTIMLTDSIRAAYEADGRFWSWINVEDEVEK